jgi:ADP-heptose:LPS heptosyltransferase
MESRNAPHPTVESRQQLPDIHKIAVLRANALGDFIFTLPALEALRKTYPQAEVVLLGLPWHASFLAQRPSPIDRVIIVPPYEGVSSERPCAVPPHAVPQQNNSAEVASFFACMQLEHFDLAIQIHGGGRYSNAFINQLGTRFTVGLRTPDAPELDRWLPYTPFQHELLRFQEVMRLVGASEQDTTSIEPHLVITPTDLQEAERIVPETLQPLVALHPGARDPRRRWSPQNFAAVGDALAERGARIVITGNESERAITAAVAEHMHAPAQDLAGQISLNGLTGLLARCRLMVSNDTGPLHIASAIHTPTVGIYWCVNLLNFGPLLRQRNRPHISWQMQCSMCGKHSMYDTCEHRASLVDTVTVDEVLESALDLFG